MFLKITITLLQFVKTQRQISSRSIEADPIVLISLFRRGAEYCRETTCSAGFQCHFNNKRECQQSPRICFALTFGNTDSFSEFPSSNILAKKLRFFLRSFSFCDRNFRFSLSVVRNLCVQFFVRKQTILTVFSWMFHHLQASDVISDKLCNYFSFHIPPNSLFTNYNIRHYCRAHVFGICGQTSISKLILNCTNIKGTDKVLEKKVGSIIALFRI